MASTTPRRPRSANTVKRDAVADFRKPFRNALGFDVRTAVILLVGFGVIRMALVLQANVTGSYQVVSLVFVTMAVLPWVVLTRSGRRRIGIVRPARWRWIPVGIIAGAGCCLTVFLIVTTLWKDSFSNPFVYIARTYSSVPSPLSDENRFVFFVIFTVIGMTFSPIGEELLYRAFAHESLAVRPGSKRAALIDAAAFGGVHLAHFGIVYLAGSWAFLPVPALVWFASMFLSSLVFYGFRALSGSVLGAITAHAGFNIAMNVAIFYGLGVF